MERSIKAAEKDPSTTVVTCACSTGATVVGNINAIKFWQRQIQPPSFLCLLLTVCVQQLVFDCVLVLCLVLGDRCAVGRLVMFSFLKASVTRVSLQSFATSPVCGDDQEQPKYASDVMNV